MAVATSPPVTRLCSHTRTSLHYRGANRVADLLGIRDTVAQAVPSVGKDGPA